MSKDPKSNEEKKSSLKESASDWFDKGIEKCKAKDYQKALDCFKKVIEIDPKYEDAWFQLGWVYSELYNAQKPPEDPFGFDDDPFYGENDLELLKKVINSYEKAVSLEPENWQAWYNLGKKYQDEYKNYQKAIDCYKKALEFSPEFSYAWNNMGLAYDELGNRQKAAECYEKAVKFDPKNQIAWINYAINQHFLKNYSNSMECYYQAMEIEPLDYTAQMSLQAAMESIKSKVEPNIKNINLWLQMGVNYAKLIIHEKAIEFFKQVIEIDVKIFAAWHNISIAYHQLNDHQKFLDCFEKPSKLLKDLRKVSIITTDQGSFYPDVFWLLESSSEIGIIPSEGPDSDFLLKVQPLPGFDNKMVIMAMTSSEDNIFVCWEKKK